MGRRNTRLKRRCLVFGPEGFAGASEELAQQLLPTGTAFPARGVPSPQLEAVRPFERGDSAGASWGDVANVAE
jgi:hypothetical protein